MFGWIKGKTPRGYDELMAHKDYADAVEIARAEVREQPRDLQLRLRLADALALADRKDEAIEILSQLSDMYAVKGQMAKGIALLKKIQRLDPTRTDIDEKLSSYASLSGTETFAERLARLQGLPPPKPAEPEPSPEEEAAIAELSEEEILGGIEDDEDEELQLADEEAAAEPVVAAAAPEPVRASSPPTAEPAEPAPAAEPEPEPVAIDDAIPDLDFEAIDLEEGDEPGRTIESPLFGDFSKDELLAVVAELDLATFDPGQIVMTEGELGDSLFVVTEGTVRVYVRDPTGANREVRRMGEGTFFGEISILAGKPRTATITAATRCELLVLERPRLDAICEKHPRVRFVLHEFYAQRSASDEERKIRGT